MFVSRFADSAGQPVVCANNYKDDVIVDSRWPSG